MKEADLKPVSLFQLFRYATAWDKFLMFIGIFVSLGVGIGRPVMAIIIGSVSNNFISAQKSFPDFFNNETASGITSSTMGILPNFSNPTVEPPVTLDGFLAQVRQSSLNYTYLGVAMLILGYFQMVCWLTTSERQIHVIRQNFFKAILRQEIAYFDENQSGEMTAKLSDHLERIKEGTGDKCGLILQYLGQFVGGFVVAFIYQWKMTLVMMSVVPLLAFFGFFAVRLISGASKREQQQYSVAGGIAEEVLSCVRTVIAFNGQDRETGRYKKALDVGKTEGIKKSVYSGILQGASYMVLFAAYALAFWYGAKLVIRGEIEPGRIFTVFFCVLMGSISLGTAAPLLSSVAIARGSAAAVYEVIDRVPSIDAYSDKGKKIKKPKGRIIFQDVRFRYPSRKDVQVLNGLSFEVEQGQTLALCGSSGCGKSTVVNLLLRFYDPDSGKVTIDGNEVKNINLHDLRNFIGVVSQEPNLFETTIENNIKFGREDISRQEMVRAAKMANCHDFISKLPQGYDTICGEGGSQLSGGQKQRIAIARALVRDPKILLLDEATSALDAESEGIVQEALDRAAKGRTTIVIAHRLSTIRNADRILALDKGTVVESGNHDELMEKKGFYYQLVTAQLFDGDAGSGYVSQTDDSGAEVRKQFSRQLTRQGTLKRQGTLRRQRTMSGDSSIYGSEYSEDGFTRRRHSLFKGNKVETEKDRLKKELQEEGTKQASFFTIFREAREEWGFMFVAAAAAILNGVVMPAFALLLGQIMNVFSLPDDELRSGANLVCLLFVCVGILNASASACGIIFFGLSGERMTSRLRLRVFHNVLRQDVAYFDDPKHSTGKICTRLATDAPNAKLALDYRLFQVIGAAVALVCGLAIAFYYGWQMALLLLGLLPLMVFAGFIRARIFQSKDKEDTKLLEEAGKVASEAIENVRTVQALAQEYKMFDIYTSNLEIPYQHSLSKAHVQALTFTIANSMFFLISAAAFEFGGFLVQKNLVAPVDVFQVFFAINICGSTLGAASSYFPELIKARYSAALIYKMIAEEPKIDSYAKTGLKPDIDGAVAFNDVYFSYPMRPTIGILNGLQISVKPGQTLALVGMSGCGKSTVVKMIERFYDPSDGNIQLDDFSLKTINIKYLRNQLALVSQEPVLFDCSLEENIMYGLEETVGHDKVVECAKLANIHNFISGLPEGYDTRVGEKGTQLSGGQKQRIAIARALIRNPKVLLLDEATSALDTESEKIVQEALDRAREGRTCIVIAHRLSTVQNADIIAVMKNGKVIEQGTHSDLVAAKGAYYSLTKKQNLAQ